MSDTNTATTAKIQTAFPKLWVVILHNDNYTPMEFVVEVLVQLFNKNLDDAQELMLTVHIKGQAQAGIYSKEIALQKCLEVRRAAEYSAHPLLATAEEMP